MQAFYMARKTVLINYTKEYFQTSDELLSSDGFYEFLKAFLHSLKEENTSLYQWILEDQQEEDVMVELIKLLKMMLVLELDELDSRFLKNQVYFNEIVELAYNFWRSMQRYSIVFTKNESGLQLANFIDADNQFNQMVLNFYRLIQQKVQGSKNKVYRQLQAGTNASLLLREYSWYTPSEYSALKDIPFINTIMLRTPLIIHPKSNKRLGTFTETKVHPMSEFNKDEDKWMCYPCKVGNLLTYIYFHQDFTSSVVGLPNLFELASDFECIDAKPECIILFGNKDGSQDTTYFYDKKNDIWVGKVSYQDVIEYFGYLKKMALTLHNLKAMQKGWLPIHGAMINLYLKDGRKKGLVLMGDSGAGKSETIEAMTGIAKGEIIRQEIIFDDMGVFKIEDGKIVASGTEIGAFVRLDDLDKGTAYRDMDRSVFFNPESHNARVVIPVANYQNVTASHQVDMFLYANNYTDKRGIRQVTTLEEAKPIFVEGKRFALGTTQEKGLSTTYFANPFGPMQMQEVCNPLIDKMFKTLFETNVYVGETYTCLGLEDKGNNGIVESSRILFEEIKAL